MKIEKIILKSGKKKIELTSKEARELYEELRGVFGGKPIYPIYPTYYPYYTWYSDSTTAANYGTQTTQTDAACPITLTNQDN